MIAVDSNVLVYAHRADLPQHPQASAAVRRIGESGETWAIPWPCVHEFLATVTNARIFKVPSPVESALEQVRIWVGSPWLVLIGETEDHVDDLSRMLRASGATGPRVHDARIAAICIGHRVQELWSVDRDFRRFPGLRVVNPLESVSP